MNRFKHRRESSLVSSTDNASGIFQSARAKGIRHRCNPTGNTEAGEPVIDTGEFLAFFHSQCPLHKTVFLFCSRSLQRRAPTNNRRRLDACMYFGRCTFRKQKDEETGRKSTACCKNAVNRNAGERKATKVIDHRRLLFFFLFLNEEIEIEIL